MAFSLLGAMFLSLKNSAVGYLICEITAPMNNNDFVFMFFITLTGRMLLVCVITVLLIRFSVVHSASFYLSLMGFSVLHTTIELTFVSNKILASERKKKELRKQEKQQKK